jgi:hypothetical protein
MWRYNYTDYYGIENNSKNNLYHSDIYLGKDFSDGIKHWKYIKREKVNGKWRYYYKNSDLDRMKRDLDDAKALDEDVDKVRNYARNNLKKNQYAYISGTTDGIKSRTSENRLKKDLTYNLEKIRDDKRKSKYEKYLIKPLNKTSDAIHKGKTKVTELIGKLSKKLKDINKKYKIAGTNHTTTIYGPNGKKSVKKWTTY